MKRDTKCDWWKCDKIGEIPCKACEEVWYCSREHQRLDWQDHYLDCKSYKVKYTEEAGNYLVASRKIKSGSRILADEPLAVGPLMSSELVCLTCLNEIVEEDFIKCPDCHWPMCSSKCYLSVHHDRECSILSKDKKQWAVPSTHGSTPRYDLILILRCLMLKEDKPEMFKTVMSMASHHERMTEMKDPFHTTAVRFLTEIWGFPQEEVDQARGAIVCNSFEVRGPGGNIIRALYPVLRLFNHSCLPNVQLSANADAGMEAKAAVDIDKDTELVITYPGTSQPIWQRQEYLSKVHNFQCGCPRCRDPTELGTFFSVPKCPKCKKKEYLLPIRETSIWLCRTCNTKCDTLELQQEVDDWLFRLDMNEFFGTGSPHKIANGLFIIEKEFHQQHFVYLKASQAGLHKLKSDKTLTGLRLKRDIWQNIQKIFDTLEPGLTRHRGMIFFELANVLFSMAEVGEEDPEFSRSQLDNYKREARHLYRQAFQILHIEPRDSVEYQLSSLIQRKMYD